MFVAKVALFIWYQHSSMAPILTERKIVRHLNATADNATLQEYLSSGTTLLFFVLVYAGLF